MSRALRKYMIVHYLNDGPTRECDAEAEEMGTVWAASPKQAVAVYCLENDVHESHSCYHAGRMVNEWYGAEEVDE